MRTEGVGEVWSAAPAGRSRPAALVLATHPFTVGAVALAAVGYLFAVDPARPGHYPGCPLLFVTGHYCPGCGGLRALHDLFHGDVAAALSSNVLVVLALPAAIVLWFAWTRNRLSGKDTRLRMPAWAGWSVLAVMLAFWVLRNLPATAWLAP